MPKKDILRVIDTKDGRGRRSALMENLYQQFIIRPSQPQPDDEAPNIPGGGAGGKLNDYNRISLRGGMVDAHFTWNDSPETDFHYYGVRWKMGDSTAWNYTTATSSSYWLENLPWGISGSLALSAVDIWGNSSDFSRFPIEFNSSTPPYWEGGWPEITAPSMIIDFTGRDLVMTILATASELGAITGIDVDFSL